MATFLKQNVINYTQSEEKTNGGNVSTGEETRKLSRRRCIDNLHAGNTLNDCEITSGMTEKIHYWEIVVNTGPQRCGIGL